MSAFKDNTADLRNFLAPRYWPTWSVWGLVWLLARLPYALQIHIGRLIGLLAHLLARRRRHICTTNLALCFPELEPPALKKLVRDTFIANGIGVMEVGLGWCRRPQDFSNRLELIGLERLLAAKAMGRGVLLVSAHFSTMEFVGSMLTTYHPIDVTYRRHKNPLFETLMKRGRQRIYGDVIERKQVRRALRRLREGNVLWYAPDQDYGPRHSVFARFFGVTAATITATGRFASYNQSPVIFIAHYRKPDNSAYTIEFSEVLENFPSGDELADAQRINNLIEAAIRRQPDQYIWLHRRFKTRPPGQADVYVGTHE